MRVSGLHKSFGRHPVLTGVDLDVASGSFTALLGPSGSGKTTLLRVIAGFERADAGSVEVGGRIVDDGRAFVSPARRRIGFVSQEGTLFPHLTVGRNIGFGLPRGADRKARVAELLELVGMAGLGRRYPHQLSGGQQQRVALARALAVDPEVVLLDEPFSSLDATLRASVRAEVRTILRTAGTTALLVTHDQDEALSLADSVAVIRDGRIGQCASPLELYAWPADPELARFLGEVNLLPGRLEGSVVATELGRLAVRETGSAASTAGGEVVVLVRPEQVELHEDSSGDDPAARVVDYQYFGHDALVRVVAGGSGTRPLLARVTGDRSWPPGSTVRVRARGPVLVWSAPAGEASGWGKAEGAG
jgi:iron(III) transport system ATP-binding protein